MNKNKAERAFADLNLFGAVIGLLESGAVCTPHGQSTSMRIIGICKSEMQIQLKAYDSHSKEPNAG